jgi:hypothetical protein
MLTPIAEIKGEDEEDTRLLKEMATDARNYVTSFHWCLPIRAMYLADGIGGIVALFLFEFDGKIGGTDDKLWVVVGDLPSAYMIVEPDDCAQEALERYCLLMDDWIAAVRNGDDFEKVYPVSAPRTAEYADMLQSRLDILREDAIPGAPTDPVNVSDRGATKET